MKRTAALLWITISLSPSPASASSSGDYLRKQELITRYFKYIPNEGVRRGLQRYIEILAPDQYGDEVRGSNIGLEYHFEDLWNRNRCFQDRAAQFLRAIDGRASGTEKPANLASVSKEPGWVWNEALKFSNGDANFAMALVGICGHDDFVKFRKIHKRPLTEAEKDQTLKDVFRLEEKRAEALRRSQPQCGGTGDPLPRELRDIDEDIAKDRKTLETREAEETVPCPSQDSDFYVAQSLSAEADIPQELKKEIVAAQAPGTGGESLPAKYYHVYGGAYMTCQMIQSGMPPLLAVEVEKQAARMYRSLRMCEALDKYEYDTDRALKMLGANASDVIPKIKSKIRQYRENGVSPCVSYSKELQAIATVMNECNIDGLDDAEIEKRTLRYFASMDASALYRNWYVDPTDSGFFPCTDIRLGGPASLKPRGAPILSGKVPARSSSVLEGQPKGWSKARYEAALEKLRTWDVDFEWTIAQHEAGASFAAKHCVRLKEGEKPFARACGSLAPANNKKKR